MSTAHRLVFFGTDAFSVPTLVRLISERWHVVAVVTKPDSHVGRGRQLTMPAVKKLALASGIPVLQPQSVKAAAAELAKLRADAGIVVAYGKLIPAPILELFPRGFINIHPSLLPRYRGASPIETAILNGDDATGVSLMKLDAGMDTGPTYDATKLQLTGAENRLELYERLAELGAEFLTARLEGILEGNIVPIPQDHVAASHTSLIKKSDGLINWTQPAKRIEREIRAYLGWPGSRTQLAGADVTITGAHLSPADGRPGQAYRAPSAELAVYAGAGSLIIDRLIPAGRREMTGLQFLTGHPLS